MKKAILLFVLAFLSFVFHAQAQNPDAFITTWQTATANESITIPVSPYVSGYNYTVDWGDGNISSNQTGNATHTYANAGTHTVRITGNFPAIQLGNDNVSDNVNDEKLQTIEQWGNIAWGSMNSAFEGAANLQGNATDAPDLSNVTDMSHMFEFARNFNQDLSSWNLVNVTNLQAMFRGAVAFNGDISTWNVSNVTDMSHMFEYVSVFNQNLSNWNTINVTNLQAMFKGGTSFNGDISTWNVSNVTDLSRMFENASNFNQDISAWDVSNVTNMSYMFLNVSAFNQDISSWNVSNVTNMSHMLENAGSFDQNIGNWNISNVSSMVQMLNSAGLSTANYDATLIGWAAQQNIPSNITLGTVNLTYCVGETARQALIDNHGWTIDGDSKDPNCNNNAPVIASNGGGTTASIDVDENTTTVTTVTATDADAGTTLIYSLSGGSDQDLFTINGTTGVLTFKSAPDFENPTDANGDNNYEVTVQAYDGANTDEQAITVSVTDVNENSNAPVIISNGGGTTASIDVDENTTDVTTVTATDADAGTTLTYSLSGGADQGLFTINGTTGVLTFKSAPDFENPTDANADNHYEVTVQVSDGTNTDNQTITATVTDVDESAPTDAFITTWKTTTTNESITIPINPDVSGYNYAVDWGDGNISVNQTGNATHTYANAGTHTVSITGNFPAIQFGNDNASDDANDAKLLTIKQWGTQVWHGMVKAFMGCKNLTTESDHDAPVFAQNSTLYYMFSGCSSFNSDLNDWDLNPVGATSFMFNGAISFNGNISDWDVSNVTNMRSMFNAARNFNKNIGGWDVSKVTLMDHMFEHAGTFNQNLNNWDVSNVTNMAGMFHYAFKFNGNISDWKVSNVTNMYSMFDRASSFNQDISNWDVSDVTNMYSMFWEASAFNRDLGSWDISKVTAMNEMLIHCGLSTSNYDATLMGWAAQQNIPSGITLDADGLTYCAGASARQALIDHHGWTINGDSKACSVSIQPDANGILYVDSANANPGNGSSWNKALNSFGLALHAADSINVQASSSADSVKQIWVAKGTYRPAYKVATKDDQNNPTTNKNKSFILPGNIQVYGGFSGTETLLNDRDLSGLFTANKTVLSGVLDNGDHVYHILLSIGNVGHALLAGFVVTGGHASNNSTVYVNGKPVDNNYGGGIYVESSGPTFKNIMVSGDTAETLGGGIFVRDHATPKFINATVTGNKSEQGGGMFNGIYSRATLINVLLSDNTARSFGGGIAVVNHSGPRLTNVTISGNHASYGGGVALNEQCDPVLTNVVVYGNSNGIADLNSNSNPVITYSLVQGMPENTSDHIIDGTQDYDLFVDAANGNYRLKAGSEAVNKGNNDAVPPGITKDLGGNPRIHDKANGGIVDLGAYEFQGTVDSTKITRQPKDTTVCPGASPSFEVVAAGTDLTYQWQNSKKENGSWTNINNAISTQLDISNIQQADSGTRYRVIVSGAMGNDTSTTALLHVNIPPQIITQPRDTTVDWKGTAQFKVVATGSTIDYQWQSSSDGTRWNNVPNGTAKTLELSNLKLADSGTLYRVVVSNSCVAYTSDPAVLHVNPPVLTISPVTLNNGFANVPYSVTFKTSGGTKPYSYQISNSNLPATLILVNGVLSGTPATSGGYSFTVTATDASTDKGAPFSVSQNYTLKIRNAGSCIAVSSWPAAQTLCEGADAVFSVVGSGITAYQWQSKGIKSSTWRDMAGATSATLNVKDVAVAQSGMQYRVILSSNNCGSLTSKPVILTVNPKTIIITQPKNQTVGEEGGAVFSISATGSNLSYQWQSSSDGTTWDNVADGTSETLRLSNLQMSQSGTQYRAIVSSDCSNITSDVATLTVQTKVAISTQPTDQTVCEKDDASFSVSATGTTLKYQWQSSADGNTWTDISNKTTSTLNLADLKLTDSGMQYRVIVSGLYAVITSNVVTLTVHANAAISAQPQDQTACVGGDASFSVTATGTNLAYQWQSSTDGTTWSNVANGTSETLGLSNLKTAQNEMQYRVVVSGSCGDAISNAASLTVNAVTTITTQPSDQIICENSNAFFNVSATGTALSYQWQSSAADAAWNNIKGETTSSLELHNLDPSMNGTKYRVIIDGACQNVVSDEALLTVHPIKHIYLNKIICFDDSYYFGGKNIAQAGTYIDSLTAATGCDSIAVLHLTIRPEVKTVLNKTICEGQSYQIGNNRYSASGTYEDTLNAYTGCDSVVILYLTVNPQTAIAEQPANVTVCPGSDASFTVKATGKNIQYQWLSSTDGKQWKNVDGATNATLTLSDLKVTDNGTQYKALVTGTCKNVTSNVATLTVNVPTVIQSQPTNQMVCAGEGVKYTVKANGRDLSYQWQSSTDGSTWNNVIPGTSGTLKLSNLETSQSGTQYRVVVSGACQVKTSNTVKLTVNPVPEVTIVADSTNPVSKGWPVHLTADGADSYRWNSGPGIQSGWNSSVLTIRPMKDATYTVTGTSDAGCSMTQSYIVNIIVDYKLICNNIVSPNGDGKNDRWVIQNIAAYQVNEVMIFDRTGRMIYRKKGYDNQWDGTVVGRPLKEGTYYYVFKVDGGKKIFKGFIELLNGRR